jgi:hypothetical protein
MMRYMRPLLDRIERGKIDPSFVITHRLRSTRRRTATRWSATTRISASRPC